MGIRSRIRQQEFSGAAAEAWVSLVVAADHLTRQAEAVFGRHGVTGDQYNVLRILRGAHPTGLARGEITERLMRRAPDTTRMLDRLERTGLVERGRDPDDARRSIASITDAGLRLLEATDPELERSMEAAMGRLSPDQLAPLARLCDALVP